MFRGKMTLSFALVLGLHLLAAWPAGAEILFKNTNLLSGGTNRLQTTSDRLASDFLTDSKTSVVQSTTLTMFNNPLTLSFPAHTFTPSIWTNNAGVPGTLVGTFNSFTITSAQSLQNGFATTTDPNGINLAANTIYWEVLQIHEPASNEIAGWIRSSSQSVDPGSIFSTVASTQVLFSSNSGSTWSNVFSGNSLFRLDGLAPEPSALSPLILATAMLLRRKSPRPTAPPA